MVSDLVISTKRPYTVFKVVPVENVSFLKSLRFIRNSQTLNLERLEIESLFVYLNEYTQVNELTG